MIEQEVRVYYLEMTDPNQLRPKLSDNPDFAIRQAEMPSPTLNRYFYTAVGGDWYWIDRLSWTYADWSAWVNQPTLQTWVAYVRGTPAGYFELEQQGDDTEVAYFGLLSNFVGQGLGGHMLTVAIKLAWATQAKRVWLHTCTLDHPKALANYQARGFTLYKETTQTVSLPDVSPGPWPNAYH